LETGYELRLKVKRMCESPAQLAQSGKTVLILWPRHWQ